MSLRRLNAAICILSSSLLRVSLATAGVLPAGPEFPVNSSQLQGLHQPDVTPTLDGGFVVFWQRFGVLGQRFTSQGQAIGDEFQVSTNASGGTPRAAANANGSVFVVWSGASGRLFSADGVPFGPEFRLPAQQEDSGEQAQVDVAATSDGGFVVAWRTRNHPRVFATRFSSSADPIGSPFGVSGNDEANIESVAIAGLGSGGFVIVWNVISSPVGLVARAFDENGIPTGAAFPIQSFESAVPFAPAIAGFGDDDAVVAWVNGGVQNRGVIFARHVSRAGAPVTDAFPVSSGDIDPAIAVHQGISTITWSDDGAIRARRFANNGAPLESELLVSTNMPSETDIHGNRFPSLATAPNGDFMVAWTGLDAVRARKFTLCGNASVDGLEQCDDGNEADGDCCSSTCQIELADPACQCGNGSVTVGEECDDGNAQNGDGCDTNCTVSRCGNGAVAPGEQCDDGNGVDGDGCDSNCTLTACGNGIVTDGEECDDGNREAGDSCEGNCKLPPTATPTVTQTPSHTHTATFTRTVTATRTITPTRTVTRTVTATRTATKTFTVTRTPTPSPTPQVVRIAVGTAVAAPGDTVVVEVSLTNAGLPVAATANEIQFRADAFELGLSDCEVNRSIRKSLVATLLEDDEASTRLRFFVTSTENTATIPDGLLYACRLRIRSGTLPGIYPLSNRGALAFNPAGASLPNVEGSDGMVTVSLVPGACAGDCNGNRTVTINELITAVNIALGNETLSRCLALDGNGDGRASIEEVIRAVGDLLNGCP